MNQLLSIFLLLFTLSGSSSRFSKPGKESSPMVITGAEQIKSYITLLKSKRVGVVVNQTSVIVTPRGNVHLIDTLLKHKINVTTIFSPEHGIGGTAAAGEKIGNAMYDNHIPIVSLYGNHYKPAKDEIKDIDIMVFDIQDVGARFYTYISTLHYVMEACAENGKPLIVLDRPNPNGFYIDGPILDPKFRSFVAMDPLPVVYGMTIGELAGMMNMEGWIKGGKCELKIIKLRNYTRQTKYALPVAPSPNLTDMKAIYLYPTLCFFEGTKVSVGRGTDRPFQMAGFPGLEGGITFKPVSKTAAPSPMYKDTLCGGWDLAHYVEDTAALPQMLNLTWIIKMYQAYKASVKETDKQKFFTPFFDKLAGTDKLRQQIINGMTEDQIRKTWQEDLENFRLRRNQYLLYP